MLCNLSYKVKLNIFIGLRVVSVQFPPVFGNTSAMPTSADRQRVTN